MTGFDVGSRGRPADPIADIGRLVHGLTWVIGPVAPGVTLLTRNELRARARLGGELLVSIPILNRQRSLVPLRVALGILVGDDGTRWEPAASSLRMIVPETSQTVELSIPVPPGLPVGAYRGPVVFLDVDNGRIPLTVDLEGPS